MKRNLLFIVLLFALALAHSQTIQQTNFELDSEVPKDKCFVYEASTSIKMLDGFYCDPNYEKSAKFSIDRYGVFPPDEGLIGGPATSDKDGVVGALPGELNVNDMGAAVYSIPIMMPNGIGNMKPEIAVTYSNQMGNGLLGWGWDLSGLSLIYRVGQTLYHDGNQTSVNFIDDRFMMDGKRLMLCDGNYGGNGAVYKTEVDEMSRIVSYTESYNGPARFVVHKKDGTVWEYGGTADSRIETQNNNNVVLKWLVNKITDPNGNYIVFQYVENQNTGESYINNIDYTLNDKAGVLSMYRVIFNYDNRVDKDFGYVFANLVQNKKILKNILIKNMMTGAVLYDYSFDYLEPENYSVDYNFMYYRLKGIGLTANGMKLNPTIISWNKRSHYSDRFLSYPLSQEMFNKVPFVGDFNGDGYSDVITVPYKITNTYLNNVQASVFLNDGNGSFADNAYYTFNFDKTLEWLYVVDFDGDGLDDVVSYYANYDENVNWKSKICAYLNRGNTFTYVGNYSCNRYFTIYPGDFCGEKKVSFFINFNNDNCSGIYYPSIVFCNGNSLTVQSLGNKAYTYIPKRIVVEDINGDEHSEVMYLMENFSVVAKVMYENNHYVFSQMFVDHNFNCNDFLFPGDFNGDGYTDFLKYDDRTYWEIAFSDGNRLRTPVSCLNNNLLRGLALDPIDSYICSLRNLSMPSKTIRTADFDGDGKTDVGVFKNTGGNHYLEIGFKMCENSNNSYGFENIRRFYLGINHSHQYVHIGNFLGHENASILGSVKSNPYHSEIPKIVSLNPHSSKFSVERITDGLGNVHGFNYEYLMPNNNSFYHYDYQWFNSDLRTVPIPVMALFADTVFSTNMKPCVTKRTYKNAMFHNKGHGFIGFEQVESKLLVNNDIYETTVIEKDAEIMGDNFMALTKLCSKYNYCNQLVALEQYFYEKYSCIQNEKVVMPMLTIKKTINYECDKPNSVLKTQIENVDYQSDMGNGVYSDIVNVSSLIVGSDDNYIGNDALLCDYHVETYYTYDNILSKWIVTRLKNMRNSNYYADNEPVGTCEIFEYSGVNPYQMTKKTSLPNTNMNYADPLKIVAEYSYDAVGHVVKQILTSPSSKSQRVTSLNYGEEFNYLYPTSATNENGWEVNISYDNNYGNIRSMLDYNNFETECNSDPFDVTVEKILSDGIKNVNAKRWAKGNKHSLQNASYYYWDKTTGNAESISFFNKNGKKLRDVTFGLNGEAVYVDITYDDFGNISSKSMPYVAGDDPKTFYYVYDKNNRLIEEICPNGLVKNYSYSKFQKTINTVSPEGISRNVIETYNPVGWRVQTVDIGGNTIDYEYFSDGKLKNVMIGGNARTKIEYDYDGRRNMLKMKDPASGEFLYEYNAYGELKTMTTAKHCSTTYGYDNMGNLLTRVESDENGSNIGTTQWIYDNRKGKVGMLSKIIYGNMHVVSYDYDNLLRIIGVNESINGEKYSTCYTYDNAGREEFVSYPSGVTIKMQYSNSGHYKSMINPDDEIVLWQTQSADAMGYITDYQLGNGVETHREYDDKTNLLCKICTKYNDKIYQNLSYYYDGFGNLVNRTNNIGTKKSESFVYDNFNRLVEIRMNDHLTGEMCYDNYGDILSKIIDNKDIYYDAYYDGSCQYAVSKVKTGLDDLTSFDQKINYTHFDKISYIESVNNSLSIDYGYDYNRIRSVEIVNGKMKEKVYVSDCEYVNDKGKTAIYTYLKGPMGVFAVCCTDEKGENNIVYVHKDHLDSWCLITDEDGSIIQKTSYDAWGNPRNDNTWSGDYNGELLCDIGFTGHEHLPEFGIINMNGRAYDPMLSMMMSPDNYIQAPDFSQNFNRYSYCFNNPLTYSDPSGEWVEWLLYGIFNGVVNVIYNAENIDDFGEAALAFAGGFVQGALTQGLGECAWIWQVVGGVAGNTIKSGINNFVKQNDGSYDWSSIDTEAFKEDVMYSLGSSLATSILDSYIIQPTDAKDGVSLSSKLCDNKVERELFVKTTGKMAGNLFSGKNMFDGFNFSKNNFGEIIPYAKCVLGIVSNGIEFTGRSAALGNVFDKLLNFDSQAFLSKFGNDMNYCYSQIRSLFFKI